MSFAPAASLVVVSRHRPKGLFRLVSALRHQTYSNFELVVVSDVHEPGFFDSLPHAENIKRVFFDKPNISEARNQGIDASAGEIIAFIDDDAVPEPLWLERLIVPFSDSEVGVAGGFVRGRNGINYQWKANCFDRCGDDYSFELTTDFQTEIIEAGEKTVPKVQGTNCAFRREALQAIGGFDPGFVFFFG